MGQATAQVKCKYYQMQIFDISKIKANLVQGGFLTVPPNFQYQNEKRWIRDSVP